MTKTNAEILDQFYADMIEQVNSDFSDAYKSVHGIRPRWIRFTSIEESDVHFQMLRDDAESQRLQEIADAEQEAYAERMGRSDDFKANKYEILAGEA